ncbi:unnamed protein product [Cunninghamella echinulata]
MQLLLVDPLSKLYELDLKVADTKRRQFEEESKEYYAFLTKYMGIQKNSTSVSDTRLAETKYLFKKRRFDLVRFDYYFFLVDLHGGKKEQEVLFHLLSYHQKEHAFYKTMANNLDQYQSGLDDLGSIMAEISKSQQQISKDRIEKRKWLESKYTDDITTDINELPSSSTSSDPTNSTSDDFDKFQGIRDLEQQDRKYNDLTERRKEGFLFSTSKPLKPNSFDVPSGIAWHKYWCVLSGGKLHEYSNWKKLLESHIEPINLRFATVREARNADRRFSFEVITPQLRRIYQATSQDEMLSWINTIQNAIESLLNGTGTSLDLPSDIDQDLSNEKHMNIESLLDAATLPPSPTPSKSKSKSRLRKSVAAAASASTTDISSVSMKKSNSSHRKSFSGALRSVASGIHSYDKASLKKQPSTNDLASLALSDEDPIHIPPLPTTQHHLIAPPSNNNNNNSTKSSNEKFRWSLLSTHSTSKDSDISNISKSPAIINGQYIFTSMHSNNGVVDIIRSNPSNHFCADCNEKNPDWCSLNLGIFLCIECSGIHRSMGTHVSKVRSLTLDNSSYSPDILALLQSIGNEKSNKIWEATLASDNITKISPLDRREKKLQYIQEKYVVRSFIEPPITSDEKSDINLCLFKAIHDDDIPAALRAIVLGANVNSCYKMDTIKATSDDHNDNGQHQEHRYAFHLALLQDRDAQFNNIDKNDDINSIHDNKADMVIQKKRVFPMAEFLFQNGADAGIIDPSSGKTVSELIGMDGSDVLDDAIEYLNMKNTARGQSLIYRSSLPPSLIKK